ncbi:chromosome partition protein Smc [Acrasis kona]|uniref:Chromosome partition protein Smc n=1 Tax=Acrasis kona TaxID=1008807 RepID=A0AAW2Z0C4_9EUKA
MVTFFDILNYIFDILRRFKLDFFTQRQYQDATDTYRYHLKNKTDLKLLGQGSLDARWERDTNTNEWFFNHTQNRYRRNYSEKYDTKLKSSVCTFQQLVESLQIINKNTLITTQLLEFKKSPSLVNSNNQKQRKLRKLKHEIYMAAKVNQLKNTLYSQKMYMLGKSNINNFSEPPSNVRQPENYKNKMHLIREIDHIQELYDEACFDAIKVEHEQRVMLQRTAAEQHKERETLNALIKSYLHAPVNKDEKYRNINKQIFSEHDDDPFLIAMNNIQNGFTFDTKNIYAPAKQKYPKLDVLSKKTEADRERRRELLLTLNEDDEIEVDRINGLMMAISHGPPL